MLLKLGANGKVTEVLLYPTTKLGACARETLLRDSFSPPPPARVLGGSLHERSQLRIILDRVGSFRPPSWRPVYPQKFVLAPGPLWEPSPAIKSKNPF
jgi:hypothetical protein